MDFTESARDLTMDWTRRLKLKHDLTRTKAPELDIKTAWQYCTGDNLVIPQDHLAILTHRQQHILKTPMMPSSASCIVPRLKHTFDPILSIERLLKKMTLLGMRYAILSTHRAVAFF